MKWLKELIVDIKLALSFFAGQRAQRSADKTQAQVNAGRVAQAVDKAAASSPNTASGTIDQLRKDKF